MIICPNQIFDEVLVKPLVEGANRLLIVSGYATANMVARHGDYVSKTLRKTFSTELIIGMGVRDGIEIANHRSLVQLQQSSDLSFKCDYVIDSPPVHSKVYVWMMDEIPYKCFSGSANFTQNGFSTSMREAIVPSDAYRGLEYFKSVQNGSMNCCDDRIETIIDFYKSRRIIMDVSTAEEDENYIPKSSDRVTLTLLHADKYEVPARSGLNWGQRPGREPNQAYINIPTHVGRSGFFPEIRNTFTIITDDDKHLICVRAQENGKGLHTTLNNSLMGEYFRYRLGLSNGEFVRVEHLIRYGRTDVDIYKIDEETYYMDFSV